MPASVLLIDDDLSFSASIKLLFAQQSIQLDYTDDWERGIGLFRVAAHQLVIADYNLPSSTNGLMLLLAAKRLHPSSRLVLISGVLDATVAGRLSQLSLIDGFHVKDSRLSVRLLEEARAALERSDEPSDWPLVAHAHMKGLAVQQAEVEEVDRILRGQVSGS